MKKYLFSVFAAFALLFVSCQSTNFTDEKTVDFSANGGKTLDGYWEAYTETKDVSYLDKIVACVETDDLILKNVEKAYKEKKLDDSWIDFLEITNVKGKMVQKYDLDCLTVLILKGQDQDLISNMRYLYSLCPEDLLIRNAVKSSAFWSLASVAEQRADVRVYLEEKLPRMSEKSRNVFYDIYDFYPCITVIENSSKIDADGIGARTTYRFYEDGTWLKIWNEKSVRSDGQVYTADCIEACGTYSGNPLSDGEVKLDVYGERYWQQMDREIEELAEQGVVHISDMDMAEISIEEEPVKSDLIKIKNGKVEQ